MMSQHDVSSPRSNTEHNTTSEPNTEHNKTGPNTKHRTHPNTKADTFRNRTPNTTTSTDRRFLNNERRSLPTLTKN